jgi:pimeloyl-ACP methyl ester carboxylesterase
MTTTDDEPPRLVLLPGLGADERLFHPQRRLRASVEVIKWTDPRPPESFRDYAHRLAGTIRSPRPYWLVGVSLGGMIAMELARLVEPSGVVLVSSCRSCAALPWWGRAGRVIVRAVPAAVQKWANLHVPGALRALGACQPCDRNLIRDMIRDTPAPFLQWGLAEALRWPGVGALNVPVYQVHGACDRTIPCPTCADEVIPGGGHLINLTHADIVNGFIERALTTAMAARG